MTEEEIRRRWQEVAKFGGDPVVIDTDVFTVFNVVALLQLALRHPNVTGEPVMAAQAVIAKCRDALGKIDPLFAEIIDRGNDRANDLPVG